MEKSFYVKVHFALIFSMPFINVFILFFMYSLCTSVNDNKMFNNNWASCYFFSNNNILSLSNPPQLHFFLNSGSERGGDKGIDNKGALFLFTRI